MMKNDTKKQAGTSELAKAIRQARIASGLSLSALAERSGLAKSYIWNLERGTLSNPTVSTLFSLARAMGADPHRLYEGAARDAGLGMACDETAGAAVASRSADLNDENARAA